MRKEFQDYTKEDIDNLAEFWEPEDKRKAKLFLELRDLFHNAEVSMTVDHAGRVVDDTLDEAVILIQSYRSD
jgi:hypothetical protein